jgi:hypothetical protein
MLSGIGVDNPLNIKLGISIYAASNITLSINEINNIPDEIGVYLYDAVEDALVNLREHDHEVHLSEVTDDRFTLKLTLNKVNILENHLIKDIQIYTNRKTVFIKSEQLLQTKGHIFVFDLAGRVIISEATEQSSLQKIEIPEAGTYMIKVISNNKIKTEKIIAY